MTLPATFAAVIGLWKNATVMAEACNAARLPTSPMRALNGSTVRGWRKRNIIPPSRFAELAAAAAEWGFTGITVAYLNWLYNAKPRVEDRPPAGLSEYG